ncbi:unnamed protein product [Linum tenue]|uniref:Uncharacterized protein n=1 Tax=Linum tenue TaxID=586396 RepID=A0AAV0NDQ9_9ROSI|nr:unnamed protein product [Linum tenue]
MLITYEPKSGDDEAAMADKLQLIDTIQRLGVGYHFETEIEEALEKVYDKGDGLFNNMDDKGTDLYHATLRFRLLRQHGFPVSHDWFTKLKDNEGRFNEWLSTNDQGLLSLYEAAHMAFNGEDILDEALSFATKTLKYSILPQTINPRFQKHINFALCFPVWKCIPRLLARYYIDFYSEDPSHNQKLLMLAKLDFNMVQNIHQQELREISNWWQSLQVTTNFPYARDRVVECYFCINAIYFEPKYRLARTILNKVFLTLSLVDDTFDNFATYEELQILTEAIQRFDGEAIEALPDTMKNIYRVIVNTYDEINVEVGKLGSSFGVEYAKAELEREREHVASAVECYVKENLSASLDEAVESFRNEISIAWKDTTEEYCQNPTPLPVALTQRILNYARCSHVLYEKGDGYTDPYLLKAHIASLFIDHVPL